MKGYCFKTRAKQLHARIYHFCVLLAGLMPSSSVTRSAFVVQTYANTGDKTVWVRGGPSGLNKRKCTALFADGEPRVKPLLIFRGLGKRISLREKVTIIFVDIFITGLSTYRCVMTPE